MDREQRIKEYLDLAILGEELLDKPCRRVSRRTSVSYKSNKSDEIITQVTNEEISFT